MEKKRPGACRAFCGLGRRLEGEFRCELRGPCRLWVGRLTAELVRLDHAGDVAEGLSVAEVAVG